MLILLRALFVGFLLGLLANRYGYSFSDAGLWLILGGGAFLFATINYK